MIWKRIAVGAAAGAAGTTALNAVTYLDMVIRGRSASNTPEESVERLGQALGVRISGDDDARANRLNGAGSLAGISTGVGVGIIAGLARPALRELPRPVSTLVIAGAAMLFSNGFMAALGVTDPRKWPASSWIADLAPHLAYGAATDAVVRLTP